MKNAQTDEQIESLRKDAQRLEDDASELTRNSSLLASMRGVLFFATVIAGLIGWLLNGAGPVGLSLCGLFFAALVCVVIYQNRLQRKADELETRAAFRRHSIARLEMDWDALPRQTMRAPDTIRAEAVDLDLFGPRSLFRWLCQANTPAGVRKLRDWISQPAAPDEIRSRQAAVKRLQEENELREELAVSGQLLAHCLTDPDKFLEWVDGDGWFHGRQWTLPVARVLAASFLLAILAFLFAPIPPAWSASAALLILIPNIILGVAYTGSMHDVFFKVTTPSGEMEFYRELFRLFKTLPDDPPRLAKLRAVVTEGPMGADRQLKSLSQIMKFANLKRAGLFGAIYFLLQIFILWDFHAMALLEAWRVKVKKAAPQWFEALGELECLISLAAVAHDHPHWVFPDVDPKHDALKTVELGHPLLPPTSCVHNDVTLGPPGKVLLVTGSNMSGKSTLLRSLGLNAVLAHAGGPVCAKSYAGPPVVVATSMRIVDSLGDGVSFFMAELKRLKEIVDQAASFNDEQGPMLLYLLDEILQGTNSAERRIAVAKVAEHLIACRAIGAISTHDLELGDEPTLAPACEHVHFRERFEQIDGQRRMTFDYQMCSGIAPTTNALALLELVGLKTETTR